MTTTIDTSNLSDALRAASPASPVYIARAPATGEALRLATEQEREAWHAAGRFVGTVRMNYSAIRVGDVAIDEYTGPGAPPHIPGRFIAAAARVTASHLDEVDVHAIQRVAFCEALDPVRRKLLSERLRAWACCADIDRRVHRVVSDELDRRRLTTTIAGASALTERGLHVAEFLALEWSAADA